MLVSGIKEMRKVSSQDKRRKNATSGETGAPCLAAHVHSTHCDNQGCAWQSTTEGASLCLLHQEPHTSFPLQVHMGVNRP